MSELLQVFITYSHRDKLCKRRLRTALGVMEGKDKIKLWDDEDLLGGDNASQESILEKVASSDILLYVVSPDSLISDNCNREFAKAASADIRIIPIILTHCDWLHHQLQGFQALPDGDVPIIGETGEDQRWQKVVDGIRSVVDEMQTQNVETIQTQADSEMRKGNHLIALGQIDKAIEHYSHAIELEPNQTRGYNKRACAYCRKGEYSRAIKEYTRAIDLNPNYAMLYANRGASYAQNLQFDKAIIDFTEAISLKPDYVDVYINCALARIYKEDYEGAIEDCHHAVRLRPDDPRIPIMRHAARSRRILTDLSDKAKYLLGQVSADPQKQVEFIDLQQGCLISVGGKDVISEDMARHNMPHNCREKIAAEWESALKSLEYKYLFERIGGAYPLTKFRITDAGDDIANQIPIYL